MGISRGYPLPLFEKEVQDATHMPFTLFHYTSLDAFMKIVETSILRATHILYMNDSQELRRTFRIFERLLFQDRDVLDRRDLGLGERAFLEQLRLLTTERPPPIYVACFSEREDDVMQWRAYANDGRGCNIGFGRDELRQLAERFHKPQEGRFTFFARCIYEPTLQKQILEELLAKDKLANKPEGTPFSGDFLFNLLMIASLIKDERFDSERECRLVLAGGHLEQELRLSPSAISPFTNVALSDLGKQRGMNVVVLGPKTTRDLAVYTAVQWLKKHDLKASPNWYKLYKKGDVSVDDTVIVHQSDAPMV